MTAGLAENECGRKVDGGPLLIAEHALADRLGVRRFAEAGEARAAAFDGLSFGRGLAGGLLGGRGLGFGLRHVGSPCQRG
jgi:hypothetical protein